MRILAEPVHFLVHFHEGIDLFTKFTPESSDRFTTKNSFLTMKLPTLTVALLAGSAILAILAVNQGFAKVTEGDSRLLKTSQLMSGAVKPHCTAVKKGIEAGPADDAAWADIAMHAAILNEISYTLMDDKRCPDGTWAGAASKDLREGSAAVVAAAAAKDAEAALTAFKSMTASCKKCHDAHKED